MRHSAHRRACSSPSTAGGLLSTRRQCHIRPLRRTPYRREGESNASGRQARCTRAPGCLTGERSPARQAGCMSGLSVRKSPPCRPAYGAWELAGHRTRVPIDGHPCAYWLVSRRLSDAIAIEETGPLHSETAKAEWNAAGSLTTDRRPLPGEDGFHERRNKAVLSGSSPEAFKGIVAVWLPFRAMYISSSPSAGSRPSPADPSTAPAQEGGLSARSRSISRRRMPSPSTKWSQKERTRRSEGRRGTWRTTGAVVELVAPRGRCRSAPYQATVPLGYRPAARRSRQGAPAMQTDRRLSAGCSGGGAQGSSGRPLWQTPPGAVRPPGSRAAHCPPCRAGPPAIGSRRQSPQARLHSIAPVRGGSQHHARRQRRSSPSYNFGKEGGAGLPAGTRGVPLWHASPPLLRPALRLGGWRRAPSWAHRLLQSGRQTFSAN